GSQVRILAGASCDADQGRRRKRRLSAVAGRNPPRYLRMPKSVVTIVTGRPRYTPDALEAWTAEMPISLQCGSSMFLRCSGLFSHIVSACCASTSGDDQRRFSPTDQKTYQPEG